MKYVKNIDIKLYLILQELAHYEVIAYILYITYKVIIMIYPYYKLDVSFK